MASTGRNEGKPRFDPDQELERILNDGGDPFSLPIETPTPPIFPQNSYHGGRGFDAEPPVDPRYGGHFSAIPSSDQFPPFGSTNYISEPTPASLFIIEQPVDRCRFRYKAEQGPHGALRGVSGKRQKSAPKIKVEPGGGRGYAVASLWTNESIPRPHVNELWGSDCENGTCKVDLDAEMTASFPNLGVMRQKEKDVAAILLKNYIREYESNGFTVTDDVRESFLERAQKEMVTMKDCLHCVRVGFQAFVTDFNGRHWVSPIVLSTPIYNSQNPGFSELRIAELDKSCGSCLGGETIWMRCATKIRRDQIKIKFYEASTGWESEAAFSPNDVYEQILIIFKTPAYRDTNITERTLVNVYLCRTTDGEYSAPLDFVYLPVESGPSPKRFRRAVPASDQSPGYHMVGTPPGGAFGGSPNAAQPQPDFQPNFGARGWWSSTDGNSNCPQTPAGEHQARKRQLDGKGVNESGSKVRSLDSGIEVRSFIGDDEEPGQGAKEEPSSTVLAANLERLSLIGDRAQLLASLDSVCRRHFDALRSFGADGDPSSFVEADKRFIGVQDQDGNTALHVCARNKQPFALKTMLKCIEKDENRLEIVNTQNNRKQTALHLAVKFGDPDCVHYLLKAGADRSTTDADGCSPAHYLADSFNEALCRDLLFQPSSRGHPLDLNLLNNDGLAILHIAVKRKQVTLVEYLIEAKADLNTKERNTGKTALHLAAENGFVEILDLLINNGAHLDGQMHDGTTPVQLAVCQKRQSIVSRLTNAGADVCIKTSHRRLEEIEHDEEILGGESSEGLPRSAFDFAEGDSRLVSILSSSAPAPISAPLGSASGTTSNAERVLSFLNDDLATLDVLTRLQLSALLDGEGRWERLAEALGCAQMVPFIKICVGDDPEASPTLLLLDQLEHGPGFTVSRLRDALRRLRLDPAAAVVRKLEAHGRI